MAVQYFNGQYYDIPDSNMGIPNLAWQQLISTNSPFAPKPIGAPTASSNTTNISNTRMFGDPFGTAMSGGQSGTLQPYVNRMTQNASNALYGGLLNYQPQSMIAGNAGGTPQNSTVPQGFNIPSALQSMMGGQGLNFGNRSWMKQGGQ